MTMHDHSLFESYVLDHFSTDRHNKVVQTTSTKIFWDFEGLGSDKKNKLPVFFLLAPQKPKFLASRSLFFGF